MADRSPLPDKARLEKLIEDLHGPDEEMDDASAAAILEEHGVTDRSLASDLRARLAGEIEALESQGLDVPPMLRQALASLPVSEEEQPVEVDPDTWIKQMFEGGMPGGVPGAGQASQIHSFRDLNTESLSEEDRQMLERLAEELQDSSDEGKG
jgi:hypothetical protein